MANRKRTYGQTTI